MTTAAERAKTSRAPARQQGRRRPELTVPVLTPQLKVRHLHVPIGAPVPTGHDIAEAGRAVSSYLPPPSRLGYYAGLGVLAAAGVIEWPIAAAIGVGVAVAGLPRREEASSQRGSGDSTQAERSRGATPRRSEPTRTAS